MYYSCLHDLSRSLFISGMLFTLLRLFVAAVGKVKGSIGHSGDRAALTFLEDGTDEEEEELAGEEGSCAEEVCSAGGGGGVEGGMR